MSFKQRQEFEKQKSIEKKSKPVSVFTFETQEDNLRAPSKKPPVPTAASLNERRAKMAQMKGSESAKSQDLDREKNLRLLEEAV